MLTRIATLTLGPLLLAQALYVRGTTEKLPEPPGERSGRAGRGPRLRLLILGDSAAAGVGADSQQRALSGQLVRQLQRDFNLRWRLLAKTGATTSDARSWIEAEPAARFDVVMCSLGVNDVTAGRSAEAWQHELEALHTLLRERFGVRQLLFAGLPPMQQFPALPSPLSTVLGRRAAALDAALAAWAAAAPGRIRLGFNHGLNPAQMARDGFHPGPLIYAEIARRAAHEIRRQFGSRVQVA